MLDFFLALYNSKTQALVKCKNMFSQTSFHHLGVCIKNGKMNLFFIEVALKAICKWTHFAQMGNN